MRTVTERSTHTPGPWEIDEGDGMAIAKVSCFAITAPCMPNVGSGLSRDENAANARLIAAAPDLLDALRHMQSCQSCAQADWSACPRGGQQAIAAIAKAEGQ